MKPTQNGRDVEDVCPAHILAPELPTVQLVSGTVVLTLEGEMPVEFLTPGDRIITRDSGVARLAGIGFSQTTARAVMIRGGSLGDTRPENDMVLPADQPLLIRDWRAQALFRRPGAVTRAGALLDGEFICDLGQRTLPLTHLQFQRPHIIYAGGLEVACALNAEAAEAA